jgi:hypothetical protein
MKNDIDVSEAIRELDHILSQEDEKYTLYACGGSALIYLDLISSKFHATIERRGKDYDDVIWLKPTLLELETAKKYALKLGDTENYPYFVNSYFEAIKKDLAYE